MWICTCLHHTPSFRYDSVSPQPHMYLSEFICCLSPTTQWTQVTESALVLLTSSPSTHRYIIRQWVRVMRKLLRLYCESLYLLHSSHCSVGNWILTTFRDSGYQESGEHKNSLIQNKDLHRLILCPWACTSMYRLTAQATPVQSTGQIVQLCRKPEMQNFVQSDRKYKRGMCG